MFAPDVAPFEILVHSEHFDLTRPITFDMLYKYSRFSPPGPLELIRTMQMKMPVWKIAIELGRADLLATIAAAGGLDVSSIY